MAYHVTVVLNNGSKSHFYSDETPMFTDDEGVLVIYSMQGAVIHFNARNVLAWITSEMTPDEEHATRQVIKDLNDGVKPESEDDNGISV